MSIEKKILNNGFVKLVDWMPHTDIVDSAIVQAARCSYGEGTKSYSEDRALIRYLMRHGHTSPFEQVEFKFHMKIPIFVARQLVRHRTANINELSLRYSEATEDFFIPDELFKQSTKNKQCSSEEKVEEKFLKMIPAASLYSYNVYEELIQGGVSRENARMVLPVNYFTEWYYKMDLHNLLHMLALRCDKHAQSQTREVANAILEIITPFAPFTIEAWNDYHPLRDGCRLSSLEIKLLKDPNLTPEDFGLSAKSGEWKEAVEKIRTIYEDKIK